MDRKTAARGCVDAEIARIAAAQHGVVSAYQLGGAGLSPDSLKRRAEAGRLHRIFRGVYAVGHPGLSQEGSWMAAVLACRGHRDGATSEAFLSHLSAAHLWKLLPVIASPIDVAVIGENGRERQSGLRIHRPRTLETEMTSLVRGIPVTNPQRTISDLRRARPRRGGATPTQLRRAMRQAAVLGLELGPGAKPERTRSDLEVRFQRLCRRHHLPEPEVNVEIAPSLEVDFLWRRQRFVVETDGYRYHRGRVSFESDHERDMRITELGFRFLRCSDTQLEKQPARIADLVRRELAAD